MRHPVIQVGSGVWKRTPQTVGVEKCRRQQWWRQGRNPAALPERHALRIHMREGQDVAILRWCSLTATCASYLTYSYCCSSAYFHVYAHTYMCSYSYPSLSYCDSTPIRILLLHHFYSFCYFNFYSYSYRFMYSYCCVSRLSAYAHTYAYSYS